MTKGDEADFQLYVGVDKTLYDTERRCFVDRCFQAYWFILIGSAGLHACHESFLQGWVRHETIMDDSNGSPRESEDKLGQIRHFIWYSINTGHLLMAAMELWAALRVGPIEAFVWLEVLSSFWLSSSSSGKWRRLGSWKAMRAAQIDTEEANSDSTCCAAALPYCAPLCSAVCSPVYSPVYSPGAPPGVPQFCAVRALLGTSCKAVRIQWAERVSPKFCCHSLATCSVLQLHCLDLSWTIFD